MKKRVISFTDVEEGRELLQTRRRLEVRPGVHALTQETSEDDNYLAKEKDWIGYDSS